MRIVSGSLDRTIKVHSTNTKKNIFYCTLEKRCGVTKHQYIVLYIHEKVWGVSNLDCLHTMDWMSGEGHTGVVRCLQVDDRDQPRGVDVDHDDVEVDVFRKTITINRRCWC